MEPILAKLVRDDPVTELGDMSGFENAEDSKHGEEVSKGSSPVEGGGLEEPVEPMEVGEMSSIGNAEDSEHDEEGCKGSSPGLEPVQPVEVETVVSQATDKKGKVKKKSKRKTRRGKAVGIK